MKKLRLYRSELSKEAVTAIAEKTLFSGGIGSQIGDRMPDGTVYAGISPDTCEEIYAAPSDAPLTMKFNEAADYAKKLNREKYLGHDDWRVPTKDELNVLFNHRAAIGGFNVSGSYSPGWYWSSSSDEKWFSWGQRFSDGLPGFNGKDTRASTRLVRSRTSEASRIS